MTTEFARKNMTTHLATIDCNATMAEAYEKMLLAKVRHLPAINDSGEIIGIISDRDMQRAMQSSFVDDAERRTFMEDAKFDEEAHVYDYMSWPVMTIDADSDLKRVAEKMLREKVSSLLVTEGNRVAGIITTDDLLKALARLLGEREESMRWALRRVMNENGFSFEDLPV